MRLQLVIVKNVKTLARFSIRRDVYDIPFIIPMMCYRVTVLPSPKITSNLPSWTSLVSTRIKSRARSHRCRSSSLQGFRSGGRGWLVGCQVRGTCVMCKKYMCKYIESIYNHIYIIIHTVIDILSPWGKPTCSTTNLIGFLVKIVWMVWVVT